MKLTDFTHKNVKIKDIRLKSDKVKNNKFFVIIVQGITEPLYVNYDILNDRVKSYFLGKSVEDIDRSELLSLDWNFIITQGFFYKIIDKNKIEVQHTVNESKYFVSVIEIAGSPNRDIDFESLGAFNRSFGPNVTIYDSRR